MPGSTCAIGWFSKPSRRSRSVLGTTNEVRLGHGARAPYILRRPVNDVIRPPTTTTTPRESEEQGS